MPAVHSLNLSDGGAPKLPVPSAPLTENGFIGDRQRYLKFHGGPERAVCLFPLELVQSLRDQGHPIVPGGVGENLTLAGLDWPLLQPGHILRVGPKARIQITTPAPPCKNIAFNFSDRQHSRLDSELHPGHSRLYARVLVPGLVTEGDPVVWEQDC